MKITAIILSIFILGMALLPCSDSDMPASSQNSFSFNQNIEHESSHCDDFCSPFCVCHCCGRITVFVKTFAIPSFFSIQRNQPPILGYTSNYCFELHLGVWQPPKRIA